MRFKIILKADNGKVLEEFSAEGHSELIRLAWFISNIKTLYNCRIIYKELRYVNGQLTEVDSDFPTMVNSYSKLL
jgi:hypothetical protein